MITRPLFSLALPVRASRPLPSLQCRRAIHYSCSRTAPIPWYNRSKTTSLITHRNASSAGAVSALKSPSSPQPDRTSSSTTATVPVKSPTSTVPVPQVLAKLNPPDHTYAPDLTIPAKKPGQNSFKYLFQCGKLYLAFYKKGIKNVTSTAKLARKLRAKAARDEARRAVTTSLGILTRAEWQIVRRSRRDMLRLPGFAVLVLVLGEWMPLIALYITGLIPEACRIPRQVERTLRKLEARRHAREERLAIDAARLVSRDRKPGATAPAVIRAAGVRPEDVEKLDLYTLMRLSTTLDAHSRVWDWVFLTPPKSVLRWAVRRRLEYLRRDDELIKRDGGVQALGEREVRRACVERGIRVLGRGEREMRAALGEWLGR